MPQILFFFRSSTEPHTLGHGEQVRQQVFEKCLHLAGRAFICRRRSVKCIVAVKPQCMRPIFEGGGDESFAGHVVNALFQLPAINLRSTGLQRRFKRGSEHCSSGSPFLPLMAVQRLDVQICDALWGVLGSVQRLHRRMHGIQSVARFSTSDVRTGCGQRISPRVPKRRRNELAASGATEPAVNYVRPAIGPLLSDEFKRSSLRSAMWAISDQDSHLVTSFRSFCYMMRRILTQVRNRASEMKSGAA